MVSGQSSAANCRRTVVSGQWPVVGGQLSVDSCQWSVVSCRWSVASGQWPMVSNRSVSQKSVSSGKAGGFMVGAPQRGLCRSAPCRQQLIARAAGAVVFSPALQRGERAHQCVSSPVGTALLLSALRTNLREEWKNTNQEPFPQMSNFYRRPGKAGGSPFCNRLCKATAPQLAEEHPPDGFVKGHGLPGSPAAPGPPTSDLCSLGWDRSSSLGWLGRAEKSQWNQPGFMDRCIKNVRVSS